MPNRILRDWTDSEPVNSVDVHAERFFVRIIMKVDDYGRLPASPKFLRPLLFPFLLEQVREADVSRLLAECEKAGLVRLYTNNSKEYLEVAGFNQRTRSPSKYPAPGGVLDARQSNGRHASDIRRSLAPVGVAVVEGANPPTPQTTPGRLLSGGTGRAEVTDFGRIVQAQAVPILNGDITQFLRDVVKFEAKQVSKFVHRRDLTLAVVREAWESIAGDPAVNNPKAVLYTRLTTKSFNQTPQKSVR